MLTVLRMAVARASFPGSLARTRSTGLEAQDDLRVHVIGIALIVRSRGIVDELSREEMGVAGLEANVLGDQFQPQAHFDL